MLRRIAALLALTILALTLGSCTPDGPACPRISKQATNAEDLIILIQPANNWDNTATRAADDVERFILEHAKTPSALRIKGYIYGGIGTTVQPIQCMDGIQPFELASPNKDRERVNRMRLAESLAPMIEQQVRNLHLQEPADPLPLTAAIPEDSAAHVLLWSQLASNGETCLKIPDNVPPTEAVAKRIIDECDIQGRIPKRPALKSFSIAGIGTLSNPDARRLEPLSRALGASLCTQIVGDTHKCSTS